MLAFYVTVVTLSRYSRNGNASVKCRRGKWVVSDGTECVVVDDALDMFNCQPLTQSLLPNVAVDSCKDTPGYAYTALATTTNSETALLATGDDVNLYQRLVQAAAGSGDFDLTPVQCAYTCAPGYHANPAASSVVTCDLGRWQVRLIPSVV